jgi:hypothetical protein
MGKPLYILREVGTRKILTNIGLIEEGSEVANQSKLKICASYKEAMKEAKTLSKQLSTKLRPVCYTIVSDSTWKNIKNI